MTDAAHYDGALLPELLDRTNTASDVWADTACARASHRKKPKGKPMPAPIARANGRKSKVRAAVEHVFAHQKGPMGLVVRSSVLKVLQFV